ncbi:protein kinase [Waterburya agarophytonicola K14]|uniref:non-specific serine/threonine protein kinase n=1 Tax=Waterburya agarophytonicola KI4 TaxID=2874699 RepID=A0A964FEL1_9CYAN|nr:protein kinase [Waterburya agarophytonicola KI4]
MKGKIIGSRYKILEYLAEGGFGKTYLAEDTQLPGRDTCVVKQLHPSSQDPKFLAIARRLFQTEASTLHNLGHHQQIPKLLAYFEEDEKFYLVQQYIQGETLGKELDSGLIWSESQAIDLLRDGLNILKFVHGRGVIHRDVKPDNLIRCDLDGKVVLVDFGTVKEVLQGQQTNIGQLTVAVGTQGYMPTEQARGKPRPSSDLYALGMIAIQALTGIAPLDLPEDDDGEIIWESSANISRELAEILTTMTRYHFKDRYKLAHDVLQGLNKLSSARLTKAQSITSIQSCVLDRDLNNDLGDVSMSSTAKIKLVATSTIDRHDLPKTVSENCDQAVLPQEKIDSTTKHSRPQKTTPDKPKSKHIDRNIISLIVVFVFLALGGIGFFMINRTNSDSEIEPDLSKERMEQGEGFRKDL